MTSVKTRAKASFYVVHMQIHGYDEPWVCGRRLNRPFPTRRDARRRGLRLGLGVMDVTEDLPKEIDPLNFEELRKWFLHTFESGTHHFVIVRMKKGRR